MKQLTKEQLTETVHNTMVKVYEAHAGNVGKEVGSAISGEDLSTIIGKSLAICMCEVMMECNQVLIETLYDILYTE